MISQRNCGIMLDSKKKVPRRKCCAQVAKKKISYIKENLFPVLFVEKEKLHRELKEFNIDIQIC